MQMMKRNEQANRAYKNYAYLVLIFDIILFIINFFFRSSRKIILLNNNLSKKFFPRFFRISFNDHCSVIRSYVAPRVCGALPPLFFFFPARFPWRNEIKLPCIFGAKPRLAFATNFNPSYTLLAVAHHAQYDLRDVAGLVTSFPSVP